MDCSWFQCLKSDILNLVPLTRDEFHALIGLAVFIVTFTFDRRRPFWAILAVLAAATAIEAIDLVDDLASRGAPRWGASLHDILITMIIPLAIAAIYAVGRRMITGVWRT